MKILSDDSVVVYNSNELKDVLEGENKYKYIYFGNNIILESQISINKNKENVIIDGTYLNNRYTYSVINEEENYVILANVENRKITIRNIDLVSCNSYGIVYASNLITYQNVLVEFNNVKFNGVKMLYNPYGSIKIVDSNIIIEINLEVEAKEIAEVAKVEIGGNTSIISNSKNYALFTYLSNISYALFKVLPNSRVNLRSENNEFMRGTYRLDFKILHDSSFTLVTSNGFALFTIHGAQNVLIDERATFTFIETKHQRIPMWSIYGTLTVNEGANLSVINTYENTPSDNYNIHFKGSNCKIILNNPNSVILYTKNSNVLYTNNSLEYLFKINRINMWNNSTDFSSAGDINNIPDYSWYKENDLFEISGVFTSTDTEILSHNLSDLEINNLPDISNFTFQNKKQFSIGKEAINVHFLTSNSNEISGHSLQFSDVLIKYNGLEFITTSDENGLFTYALTNSIADSTNIEIIACVAGSFIYTTRNITIPYNGELTIMEAPKSINFSLVPISQSPLILPKTEQTYIKIVDSRLNSTDWKLFASILHDMNTLNGFELSGVVVFKNFSDEIITLNQIPSLIYTGSNNNGYVKVEDITLSSEKGILLNLENNALEANEEYSTSIIWNIEE